MKPFRELILATVIIGLLVTSWFTHGVRCISTGRKVVALTFDDGPNPPHTGNLLKVLKSNGVSATFFLNGQQVTMHPELAFKIQESGHEIGGHSFDWESYAFKGNGYIRDQFRGMNQAFSSAGINEVRFFRPPGGVLMPWQRSLLRERKWIHISGDVIADDWKGIDSATIRERIVRKVRPGSIIVLHDGGGDRAATVVAASQIIDDLREKGYTFLTVSELLASK
jgi:peptidoglycan/xylan/chitin deacetylase (PgdA/CDA1 family)